MKTLLKKVFSLNVLIIILLSASFSYIGKIQFDRYFENVVAQSRQAYDLQILETFTTLHKECGNITIQTEEKDFVFEPVDCSIEE